MFKRRVKINIEIFLKKINKGSFFLFDNSSIWS